MRRFSRVSLLFGLFSLPALAIVGSSRSMADEMEINGRALPTSAIVENPCPPVPPMPAAMAAGFERMLDPGARDSDWDPILARADVKQYLNASQERAKDQARTDWANLCKYRDADATVPKPVRVVFMGDSITEGWPAADKKLFDGGVVGRGISGQTSPQMLLRFYQDVIELRPRVVHIMAGTNDIAGNTGPIAVQDFKNNITAMVELAQLHHIKVVLASILPARIFSWKTDLRPAADIVLLNKWLREYAAAIRIRYIDYYSELVDDQGGFQSSLSNDGVHPNRTGYAKMRALALKGISYN